MPSNTFTCQVGTRANWVGAHYWSALHRSRSITDNQVIALYNENCHGEFYPRVFLLDTPDGFGRIDVCDESDIAHANSENVEVFDLRNSELFENSWRKIWEPKMVPYYSVCSQNTCSEYWFEGGSVLMSDERIEEELSSLRHLVEATDVHIDTIRLLNTNEFTKYTLGIDNYLHACYPKAQTLQISDPETSDINLSQIINSAADRIKYLLVTGSTKETPFIEAVWIDTVQDSVYSNENFHVENIFLEIDENIIFGKDAPGGTIPIITRPPGFTPNTANPLSFTATSVIRAGTTSFPNNQFFENIQKSVSNFEKHHKALYEQFIEQEYLKEISETLRGLENTDRYEEQ